MKAMSNLGQSERLKRARIEAKYETAAAAARALGVKPATYTHHENGTAGLSRNGEKYARFFKVDFDWLMTGEGEMRAPPSSSNSIGLAGQVSAGESASETGEPIPSGEIDLPTNASSEAYVVRGDSMRPRFFRGEILLFERAGSVPDRLVGQFCRIQLADGASYVKILRRGSRPGRWTLDSIHTDVAPIENVEIIAAFRWLGLLPPRNVEAFAVARPEARQRRRA